MSPKASTVAIAVMGASGIIAQILLLRELLVSFFGNELTIGIILSTWLALEAGGSFFIARWARHSQRPAEIFALLGLMFSLFLPTAVYLARTFKNFLPVTFGEGLGVPSVFLVSLTILLPVALIHGAMFTYGCRLYAFIHKEDSAAAGRVYVYETVGSIIGGLLMTFLLIRHFNPFALAGAVALLNALSIFPLLRKNPFPAPALLRKGLLTASLLVACGSMALLLGGGEAPNRMSLTAQWPGVEVVHNENSFYGNITITRTDGQYTFHNDGLPILTNPDPNIAWLEDFVHFPLGNHDDPRKVLILTGGAGGMITEILKHPVREVHLVELDPLLLSLVRQFPTPVTEAELADSRVHIHHADSRLFVSRSNERFDIVFLGLTMPQDLQVNRLYSWEFFRIVKERMNPEGLFVLSLPGALGFMGPELRDLNGSIRATLEAVFPWVEVIPGETNIYMASPSPRPNGISPEETIRRMQERMIPVRQFIPAYIEYRLEERWRDWFHQSMVDARTDINYDFVPKGVYLALSYLNALFSPSLAGVFTWFQAFSLMDALALILIFTIIVALFSGIRRTASPHLISLAIFTSGFAGMILELAIIFSFQILFGYLYFQLGLLVTIFMAGAAAGSLIMSRLLQREINERRLFLASEITIIAFALLLPFSFLIPAPHLNLTPVYVLVYAIFLLLSFLSGMLIGGQFPLANRFYLSSLPSSGGSLTGTAGMLYGADLLGGFAGGILGGIILLPLLGLKETCLLVAAGKTASFILLLVFPRRP